MIILMSLVTSMKDYLEVVHKLIESDSSYAITKYSDFGPVLTYLVISLKDFLSDFLTLSWLKNLWSLPIIIPDISSAMVSEISVLDGYFHNAFNFLETPLRYGKENTLISSLEKFTIGFINSFFLFLPTGTAHLITLRRFVMQGLEAGYVSGLGTIAGNTLWLCSVIFGWRFFIIPWLSFDIFRYLLGFILLIQYMWDSYNERRTVLASEEIAKKRKIFALNFLLALTEQTSVYPFLRNISLGPEASVLEGFPANNSIEFYCIHVFYILGLFLGSLSLLHFACWFWENPAFKLYMWMLSSFRVTTNFYYKSLNIGFLYVTMVFAIASIPYYGLDYAITNPIGLVHDDRITDQKLVLETSFLNTKSSDRNTRRNRGRHGRRERWKRRVRKYRTFDVSLYDQGIYDLFTMEDLNYGFDRFWLRRKMRNHRVRFRFFPGPWMRSFKKQLAKPRLESYAGPRIEFFRILFEQVYHPSFHSKNRTLRFPKEIRAQGMQQKKLNNNPTTNFSQGSAVGPASENTSAFSNKKMEKVQNKSFTLHLPPQRGWAAEQPFGKGQKGTSASSTTKGSRAAKGVLLGVEQVKEHKPSFYSENNRYAAQKSTLRKFVRKINTRIKSSELANNLLLDRFALKHNHNMDALSEASFSVKGSKNLKFNNNGVSPGIISNGNYTALRQRRKGQKNIYSKRWKQIFSRLSHDQISPNRNFFDNNSDLKGLFKNFSKQALEQNVKQIKTVVDYSNKRLIPFATQTSKGEEISAANLNKNATFFSKNSDRARTNQGCENQSAAQQPRTLYSEGLGFPTIGNRCQMTSQNPLKLNVSFQKLGLSKKDEHILRYRSLFLDKLKENNKKNIQLNRQILLHPIQFYLQSQQSFERKLRFYTGTVFRKFSIENNAPYFRVMMKRYFYYYKPTLRWKRTMKAATLRKARRKGSRIPRKLQLLSFKNQSSSPSTQSSAAARPTQTSAVLVNSNTVSNTLAIKKVENASFLQLDLLKRLKKPTHDYAVVGKRPSRYRYQIYKDVLQHWYYSPLNRLLLKLDVDDFIKRQPTSHFLNKKEENLIHLRRFLLSEHYNTLRWYTQMQHYRSMKTKIGSTKSFSSKTYNQQFQGTFKKIRHLFAITPTNNTDLSLLKFDQPLYNEYLNNSKNLLFENSIMHEELDTVLKKQSHQLESPSLSIQTIPESKATVFSSELGLAKPAAAEDCCAVLGAKPEDLITQSTNIVRQYLLKAAPIRQNYVKKLLSEKNYFELAQFMYKGQKTRGTQPITNNRLFLSQEKDYLLNEQFNKLGDKALFSSFASQQAFPTKMKTNEEILWFNLLKKWKKHVTDQEFLRNYLNRRVEKREKRKQKKEKNLTIKLERLNKLMQGSISTGLAEPGAASGYAAGSSDGLQLKQNTFLTNGLEKAINEGVVQRKNEEMFSIISLSKCRVRFKRDAKCLKLLANQNNKSFTKLNLEKLQLASQLKTERAIHSSIKALSTIVKKGTAKKSFLNGSTAKRTWMLNSLKKIQKISAGYKKSLTKFFGVDCEAILNLLKPNEQKSLKSWRRKERFLNKQKRSRKEFKAFSKKQKAESPTNNADPQKNLLPFNAVSNPLRDTSGAQTINGSLAFRDQTKNLPIAEREATILFEKKLKKATKNNQTEVPNRKKREGDSKAKLDKMVEPDFKNLVSFKDLIVMERSAGFKNLSPTFLNSVSSSNTSSFIQNTVPGISTNNFSGRAAASGFAAGSLNKLSLILKQTYSNFFLKKFKRKRSPQRRSRVRRNRGVIKKRTLVDSLKREFKNLLSSKKRENSSFKDSGEEARYKIYEKLSLFKKINNFDLAENNNFQQLTANGPSQIADLNSQQIKNNIFNFSGPKQRRSKVRRHRYWKTKRSKYSQKRRKYRKRRRSTLGKIRVLNKQMKKIKSKLQIQNWWWNNFIPNLQGTTDSIWQLEKDRQIQEKLKELTIEDILTRDNNSYWSSKANKGSILLSDENRLQIGDQDFKPLALPEAIRLRQNFLASGARSDHNINFNAQNFNLKQTELTDSIGGQRSSPSSFTYGKRQDIITKLYENLFILKKYSGSEAASGKQSPKDFVTAGLSQRERSNLSQRRTEEVSVGSSEKQLIPSSAKQQGAKRETEKRESTLEKQQLESSFLNLKHRNLTNMLLTTNSLPFYAGWDESLRKFVVTNRLLSRQEAGYEMRSDLNLSEIATSASFLKSKKPAGSVATGDFVPGQQSPKDFVAGRRSFLTSSQIEFRSAPLQGMNAATTLYWQIPFTTYDPDQFFDLGRDGFSPIGWRRFEFRHTILKSWLLFSLKNKNYPGAYSPTVNNKAANYSAMVGSAIGSFSPSSNTAFLKKHANNEPQEYGSLNIANNIIKKNLLFKLQQKEHFFTTGEKLHLNTGFSTESFKSTQETNKFKKLTSRRLKKRYKRVKKHPRTPAWFTSGPLLNQVLPVHYIYVFYKRSRLPRDRYLKRRFRKYSKIAQTLSNSQAAARPGIRTTDFTIGKRVKPKRKYHRKKELHKKAPILPRRVKFLNSSTSQRARLLTESSVTKEKQLAASLPQDLQQVRNVPVASRQEIYWRPYSGSETGSRESTSRKATGDLLSGTSAQKAIKPIADLIKEQRSLRSQQRKKDLKQSKTSLRVRPLRRRVQRQIIRTGWRYKPRAGGFVWPGDYLRLELIKAPRLNLDKNQASSSNIPTASLAEQNTAGSKRKVKRKKKRNIQEWQIQPKKYLLEKHNFKVIKKKLEKAQRSHKISERIKELNLIL